MAKDQELLDLDAICAPPIPVKIQGKVYQVPSAEGFAVGAALDSAKLTLDPGPQQLVEILNFLATWCGIPREVLNSLSGLQLRSLFERIMPAAGGPAAADPHRSASEKQPS